MANSLNFNSIDLADYGLVVTHSNLPDFRQQHDSQLIQDISYGFRSKRPPKIVTVDVDVIASTRATLDGYLDSIKLAVVSEVAKALKLDIVTDRYWNAKKTYFDGNYMSAGVWKGAMSFTADDPMAYDNTPVSSPHVINASPKTVIEAVGGTGIVLPVYTLTAGEVLTDVTIKVENLSIDEELQWTGSLASGGVLAIDVPNWVVKKEGVADMATFSGKFPRLAPNMANSIKVTALYSAVAGSLNITYRNRYL